MTTVQYMDYAKVRELIAEYGLELAYTGWGLEVYENKSTETQVRVDWATGDAHIHVGYE